MQAAGNSLVWWTADGKLNVFFLLFTMVAVQYSSILYSNTNTTMLTPCAVPHCRLTLRYGFDFIIILWFWSFQLGILFSSYSKYSIADILSACAFILMLVMSRVSVSDSRTIHREEHRRCFTFVSPLHAAPRFGYSTVQYRTNSVQYSTVTTTDWIIHKESQYNTVRVSVPNYSKLYLFDHYSICLNAILHHY